MSHIIRETGHSDNGSKPVLMVCLQNKADRELIGRLLSDRFDVIVPKNHAGNYSFDLCIADIESLERYQDQFAGYKEDSAPVFVPFLLLVKSEHWALNSERATHFADDVIPIPVSQSMLESRIKALLKTRAYSLELQRKNKKLEEEKEKYRLITENSIDMITRHAADGSYLYVSPACKKLLGYSSEELADQDPFTTIHPDDRDSVRETLNEMINGSDMASVMFRKKMKSGEYLWVESSMNPIRNPENGELLEIQSSTRDISERMNYEQRLEEEKKRFQLLAENSTDLIIKNKPDGTFIYVSPSSEKVLGYTPEELLGTCIHDYMHPDDMDHARQVYESFMNNPGVHIVTYRFRLKDGTYKWTESSVRAVRHPETDEVTEVQASLRDISDRKEYEQRLQEEKEFINTAIDSMPGIFYMLDENLNYVLWNKSLEEELGYSADEIPSTTPFDFFKEEDHTAVMENASKVLTEGRAEMEVDLITKNGEPVRYYLTGSRLSRNGNTYIVGSGVDISERVEAEYRLEQQQQLFSAIINQTDSVIYVKDSDGRFKLVNQKYLELFDKEFDEVIGKTDRKLHGDHHADTVREHDREVLKTGKALEFEEEAPVQGEIRHFLSIKYRLDDVPGFENCICGISTDITNRKETLHSLQERIKEQACLYNVAKLKGIPESIEELLDQTVDFLPDGWHYPKITEALIEFDGQRYTTEHYRDTEWAMINESKVIEGKPLRIKVVYTEERPELDEGPFLEEERQLIDAIADTTASQIQRILSQQKLKESQKRWESLVHNDPNLIQLSTSDGTIRFINPAGANMYGADSPEELIGKNFFDLVQTDEKEIIKSRMAKVLKGEKVPPLTYEMTAPDGTRRHVKIQSVPITLENGEPGLQQVAQDLTDRIHYEQKLENSLKEKEVLLQEIHHRVKNNLAVVSGMLQLQRYSSDNDTVNKILSNSEMRIKSMALIHEKLYQAQSLSEIDLKHYIQDLTSSIEKTLDIQDNIKLVFNCDSIHLNVNQAVPCALILNELITNAIEHAFVDREEGLITIGLEEKENTVFVRVKDNGRGLDDDFFLKEHRSMGFTIINTLINQLDGDLDINGEEGTRISFSFKKQRVKGSSSTLVE